MTYEWLKRTEDSRRLILIFAGWGSDARLYEAVHAKGWDVLVCTDFKDEPFDDTLLSRYSTIYLYAWSLGVYAAAQKLRADYITAAFAINGTEWPCDDKRGIPEKIFRGTSATLSNPNLIRFRRRMFSSKDEFETINPLLPENPDIEDLKHQLDVIASAQPLKSGASFWTRAYISDGDRIFPASSQMHAWSDRNIEIISLNAPHYVDLQSIVRTTIPNTEAVGSRFQSSIPTYDDNATAQRIIAQHLVQKIEKRGIRKNGRVLEIGQGSGLASRYFAHLLSPSVMDCIDLYSTPKLPLAPEMNYHSGDAEIWIASANEKWDYIVSSSAIQWFSNIQLFFSNVAQHLNEDGVFACATFLPGNLSELDSLRPTPMVYKPLDELRTAAEKYFDRVEADSEEIRITFPTRRDALRHLRLTGVGGSTNHNIKLNQLLEAIPLNENGDAYLTYHPAYILGSKKSN